MNILQSSWNWLTYRSIWNVPEEVRKTQESWKNKQPPSLIQKIAIGCWDAVKETPRALLITGLARRIFPLFPPIVLTPECISFLRTYKPAPASFLSLDNLVVGTVFEELIFRIGVQNLLKRLEHSSNPILASLGSLRNRTIISTVLFGANHLVYYLLLDKNPCSSINYRIVEQWRDAIPLL